MFSHAPWERLSGPIRDLTTGLAQLSKTKRPMNSATTPSAAGAVAAPDPEIHHPAGGSGPDGGHPEGDMSPAGARTPRERLIVLAEDWVCGTFGDGSEAELRELLHGSHSPRDIWGLWAVVMDSIQAYGTFAPTVGVAEKAIEMFLEGGE